MHRKLLAGIPYEKQYYYAYHTIKKEWSARTLHEAIKAGEDKKISPNKGKTALPMSHHEKQLAEQFGFLTKVTINKNNAGHFRIPFHDRAHMQKILDKWGIKGSIDLMSSDITE